jgi:hypothetical protein
VRPAANVDHAVFAVFALSSNRTATPHHADAPGASEPRSFCSALFLSLPVHDGVAVRPVPAATLLYAVSAQLAMSAPPIGAYTIEPPPGPVSVATVPSQAIDSPFEPGSSGFGAEPSLKLFIAYAVTDCAEPLVFVTFSSITSALPS